MMLSTATVGLLDFGVAQNSEDAREIVEHTIAIARRADALGFGRYWLAEHHAEGCCWASPELVLALIARETTNIRLGSGGLLFATHNALRVANDFSLLAQLYPDRIDLGLTRGLPGENSLALIEPLRAVAASADDFSRRLVALMSYLSGVARPQHAYYRAQAIPKPQRRPALWILGSGGESGVLAAQYGLPFALSLFHRTLTSLAARSSLATYERDFRPSAWESEPRTMVAIAGICAETGDRAREIAASAKHTTVPLSVVGTPNEWCDCVAEIVSDTGAQEIMYLDASPLPEQRLRSLELIAEALYGSDATRLAAATRPPESVYSFSGPA